MRGKHFKERARRQAVPRWLKLFVAMLAAVAVTSSGTFAGAEVSTDSYYYVAGDTVVITGDGMAPGEVVSVDVSYPDGSLAQRHEVQADEAGLFSDTYVIPSDAPGGEYLVTATGQTSGSVFTTTFDPPAATTTTLSSLPATIVYGDQATFSGTVTSTSTVNAGTVTVRQNRTAAHDCTTLDFGGGANQIGSQSITTGAYSLTRDPAVATFPAGDGVLVAGNYYVSPSPSVGTYGFRADYSGGTPTFANSNSGCQLLTVGKANTATTASVGSPVTYGDSTNVGWGVSSTKGVTGNTATGSVALAETAAPTGGSSGCAPASQAVSEAQTTGTGFTETGSGGSAGTGFTCLPTKAGAYSLRADFTDTDGNYNNSSSTAQGLTVDKASTTTTITPSTGTVTLGSSLTVAWSVSSDKGVVGNTAGGSVEMDEVTVPAGATLGCTPASRTVSASQAASGFTATGTGGGPGTGFTCTPSAVGTYSFHGTYSGDDNYSGSMSSPDSSVEATLTVLPAVAITDFHYHVDGGSSEWTCANSPGTCPAGSAAGPVGTGQHTYTVHAEVTNNTGAALSVKVQGGLNPNKAVANNPYTTVSNPCGGTVVINISKSRKNMTPTGNVLTWTVTIPAGATCVLEENINNLSFGQTGYQPLTGSWSAAKTNGSFKSAYTGGLLVRG